MKNLNEGLKVIFDRLLSCFVMARKFYIVVFTLLASLASSFALVIKNSSFLEKQFDVVAMFTCFTGN